MKNLECKMKNGGTRLRPLVSAFCILHFALLITGCSVITGTRGDIRITSWRCLWKSEAIQFSVVDSNLVATLSVGKSRSDEESIALAAAAAVQAAMKGVVP